MRLDRVPGFILFFVAADVALVLIFLIDWKIGGLYWKFTALVDPKGQADLVNWYASSKLFLIAFLFAVFARYKIDRRIGVSWLLPAVPMIFAIISFDEVAQVSTWLGYKSARLLPPNLRTGSGPFQRDIVLLLTSAVCVFVLALAYCVGVYTKSRRDIQLKYLVGVLVFVAAASIEPSTHVVALNTVRGVLQIAGEELGTLLGATMILWATYDLLVSHQLAPVVRRPLGTPGPPS